MAAGPHAADDSNRALERALRDALATFAQIPGASITDEPDLTWQVSGTPHAAFNNVLAHRLDPATAEARVHEILGRYPTSSFPVQWWTGPLTTPHDLGAILLRLGLRPEAPEFGMGLPLARPPDALDPPAGATLERVHERAALDEWLAVMSAAYAWTDADSKGRILESLYLSRLASGDLPAAQHFLVRLQGRPAAVSSLFIAGGEAFVTNIGTAPFARGRGLGRLATLATLHLARDTGYRRALLTASVAGRGLYRSLGFTEYGRLERYVAEGPLLSRLGPGSQRHIPA